jgi:hypothetical protein
LLERDSAASVGDVAVNEAMRSTTTAMAHRLGEVA